MSYWPLKKKYWQALSEISVDVLVAICGGYRRNWDMSLAYFPDEFLIVNYPYFGQEIEVHGKVFIDERDSFYSRPGRGLRTKHSPYVFFPEDLVFLGKDGLYYIDAAFSMECALEYCWLNDLKGIVDYFDHDRANRRKRLAQVSDTYSIAEFHELLDTVQPGINGSLLNYVEPESLFYTPDLAEDYVIISHLTVVPETPYYNIYSMMMIIEKQVNGNVIIDEHRYGTNPNLEEMLGEALKMRKKDAEILCLFMPAGMRDVSELKEVLFGAWVRWNSLELFDAEDARQLFLDELVKVT